MKVLIADDLPSIRKTLRHHLTKWGFEVEQADDGIRALEILSGQDPPRIALLDWEMPGQTGFEVCKFIHDKHVSAPDGTPLIYTILLTAKTEKTDVAEALKNGAYDFLSKPYHTDELRSRIAVGERLIIAEDKLKDYAREMEELAMIAKNAQKVAEGEMARSDKLLLNILPEKVALELKEKGEVRPRQYESATILFTDFKGFTRVSEKMRPVDLIRELNSIFMAFDYICEKYNLEKLKTIGDSYMCAGGLPQRNLTHALDACMVALEMRRFMNELRELKKEISDEDFWEMRLGIHTGPIVAGVVGKSRFAYDIWGDAVNTASHIESGGEVGRINISAAVHELIRDFFITEPRGKLKVKNKDAIDMFFLERLRPEYSEDAEGLLPNTRLRGLYEKHLSERNIS